MGSSRKYWRYARECARWARQAETPDDHELLERMSEAWAHVALAEDDVARQAVAEGSTKPVSQ